MTHLAMPNAHPRCEDQSHDPVAVLEAVSRRG